MDAAIAPHLYRHPLRVHSPREKLHVLPLAPSTIPSRDIRWARMASVAHQLLVHSQHWADPSKVFALIASGDHFEDDFGPMLAATLRNRSNVIIAVVDRDMGNMRVNHPYRSLYANAVSIPYLAPRHLLHHCRTVAGNREDRARHGVMFHGDTGKYDSGARAAVRDIMSLVRAGSDFVSSYAAKGDVLQLQALQAHTRARMPSSALCFAPRGDNPSSGRFFEALATGCVPIIVGHDLSWMPFGQLIVWEQLLFSISPRNMSLEQRHKSASDTIMKLRAEEARWVDEQLADVERIAATRHRIFQAVCRFLDPYNSPHGLWNATLDALEMKRREWARRNRKELAQKCEDRKRWCNKPSSWDGNCTTGNARDLIRAWCPVACGLCNSFPK
uniref:Exostosin GT47 domain-containing protein n=1 Tax=Haptolina ericina TaxID=156174 RepID=A0A7S3AC71_9EUKA